ncbi:MAG: mechanosensitive ion channel domain-containing protein [Gammaproteobacteria bacterium]
MLPSIKKSWTLCMLTLALLCLPGVYASAANLDSETTIEHEQLVTQQNILLQNRFIQEQAELAQLQAENDREIPALVVEKASKSILDKTSLQISVSQSNLDSIDIELVDAQQSLARLEKNIQEIENQLNILNIFGFKVAHKEIANVEELHADLTYQTKIMRLEKARVKHLQDLQGVANNVLQIHKDKYARINALLKSSKMLHIKQQQAKDELAFQEQQNQWLQQLTVLYAELNKLDPIESRAEYTNVERNIFNANENANSAYTLSLIARYTDQVQQIKLSILRGNSISLLNEMNEQIAALNKQIARLNNVVIARLAVLDKHITSMDKRRYEGEQIQLYANNLNGLAKKYKTSQVSLTKLTDQLIELRVAIDQALQVELSSRRGLPGIGSKALFDVGKEALLVPALAFQVVKSLAHYLVKAFNEATALGWSLFAFAELMIGSLFFTARGWVKKVTSKPSNWRNAINSKWVSLQWLKHNLLDVLLLINLVGVMFFFEVPTQHYMFIVYLWSVWLVSKAIMGMAHICLVETTHDTTGHDVRLFRRLKRLIWGGGIVTALTVFVHQLPLIYEVKTLCDTIFLFFLMMVSLLLLVSWNVVSNLILSHMEQRHPYIQKSIRLVGVMVPLLMFGNSIIGMFGYVNLVMTVSWYEGIFLFVLVCYLVLRGLLTDAMEHLSSLMIQHVYNGWLWTEAFLKPLHRILRITLFLVSGAVLFLLYGWDKQSPIVERLGRLLQYELAHVLNTTITPLSMIELFIVISIFSWTARWTREFVYRLLLSRTKDMGIRNSIAILSQYSVVTVGAVICLRVLGIDWRALAAVAGIFAFGVGLGLRDLANNFVCGFLILLERPLRVGDIVSVNNTEGEVTHIGGRAVTVRTWDHMELVVPNAEIFNKAFTNWTAKDNIVRSVAHIKISRQDNPHAVKVIIQKVLTNYKEILNDPPPEVYLKEMTDTLIDFELRYFVNIRLVKSRVSVMSAVLMNIWDAFGQHGIKAPHPHREIILRNERVGEEPKILMEENVLL